jgi:micrococcal nuclease
VKKTAKVAVVMAGMLCLPIAWSAIKSAVGIKVIDVIDGDTFVTANSQRVRLLSVNAPEEGLCGSEEAKEELERLVLNKKVVLKETVSDRWGRLVALVYADNRLVNLKMVEKGKARFSSDKSSKFELLKSAQTKAESIQIGVFGKCTQKVNVDNPKCVIKGNLDGAKKTYHLLGCPDYERTVLELDRGDRWFCIPEEARAADFVKSKNCQD